MLANLSDAWRPFFATAVYTGMRRGELVALQKGDVDLAGGTIGVSRSWEAESTKGGRTRLLPIHPELKPLLVASMDRSASHLVFPREGGRMHRDSVDLAALLRGALNRAGLVDGLKLKCRRCAHQEASPVADRKPCPTWGLVLWSAPISRRIRFHN